MTPRLINLRDLQFVLYELLEVEALSARARYADHSRETFDAAIDTALKIATEHFAHVTTARPTSTSRSSTASSVRMIPGGEGGARRVLRRAGFMAPRRTTQRAACSCPVTVAQACLALFNAANVSTAAYPFLPSPMPT